MPYTGALAHKNKTLLGGPAIQERAMQRVWDEEERLILLNVMATQDRLWKAEDRVRAIKEELEARADNWDQQRWDEIKSLLKIKQRGCIDDAIKADRRLRELLAA